MELTNPLWQSNGIWKDRLWQATRYPKAGKKKSNGIHRKIQRTYNKNLCSMTSKTKQKFTKDNHQPLSHTPHVQNKELHRKIQGRWNEMKNLKQKF